MLDKLTDNMKFFLLLIVYVVYLTWWAATMNTTVEQQIIISNKTVELLDAHIEECKQKDIEKARTDYVLKSIRHEIEELREDLNGPKKRRDKVR